MNILSAILAVFSVASLAGSATVWFARSRGRETIKLLETNIAAFKDSEKLKDQKIAYLEGQLVIKEETIKRLLKDDGKKA